MSIFGKRKTKGEVEIVLKTDKSLPEEVKKQIVETVGNAIIAGQENSAIAIQLIMQGLAADMVIINRSRTSVEVII